MPIPPSKMSVTVRDIGSIVSSESYGTLTVELKKPLNADALDGIEEWSHCWLITEISGQLHAYFCEILRREKRCILLKAFTYIDPNSAVVDLKPVHSLDL